MDGDPIRFDGKVAVITGAGRGLGRSHALLLASRGATVIVNDLGGERDGSGSSRDPAHEVVAEIEAAGGSAVADFSDVSSFAEMGRMVESTVARFGRLDAVIANAGIGGAVPFGELEPDRFDRLMQVHVYGTFNVARTAWPHLQACGAGRIVVTTSSAMFGGPNAAYGTAKMAIVGLMRALAFHGREYGIRANAVAPGGTTRLMAHRTDVDLLSKIAEPGKVSPTYAWLAHESCDVSGEIFGSTGGRMTRVFMAETTGYLGIATPEDARDHSTEVMDADGYWIPSDQRADEAVWKERLTTGAGAPHGDHEREVTDR